MCGNVREDVETFKSVDMFFFHSDAHFTYLYPFLSFYLSLPYFTHISTNIPFTSIFYLTWESVLALNLIILRWLIAWVWLLYLGCIKFLCDSIVNLWRHLWYHYHSFWCPVINIFKVIGISCNGRRNIWWNNDIIEKLVDTINGFVCIRIVGGHSLSCHGTPMFNCIFCIQSNLEFKF